MKKIEFTKVPPGFRVTKISPIYSRGTFSKWNHSKTFVFDFILYYHPQRSWGKAIFLHVSVILFTGWGGGIPACTGPDPPLARRPPWQTDPPGRQTPWQGDPLAGIPRSPGKETPSPPALRDTVNERVVCILLECNLVIGLILSA